MFRFVALVFVICSLIACSEERILDQYKIHFRAKTNDGEPLAGVSITADGKGLGITDQVGDLVASLGGYDGQSVFFEVSCPEGFVASSEPIKLILRSFESIDSKSARRTTLELICTATARYAVIVVKTTTSEIPILYQGKEIAKTTEEGVAHAMLRLKVGSRVRLELDTGSRPDLRPENPSRIFSLEKKDTFLLWNQELVATIKPKKRVRVSIKKEETLEVHAPYRLE